MRILNALPLTSHGNIAGRTAMLQILEAGMRAADPYYNTLDLLRVANGKLTVGRPQFEPRGGPKSGEEVIDLSRVDRIFVFGAGKGIQRVAKALEDKLGDHLTGGHVIGKHGDEVILDRIGVTLGGHPVPDEGCVVGCQHILAMCQDLTEKDLVFTCVGNGVSALLTLPVDGVSLEDVRHITHKMQIERGAPTQDLNPIRNHLDQMKGGRISRHIQPAMAIHIIARDPNYQPSVTMQGYPQLMHENLWLHTLPDFTTFADAVAMLIKWDAWDSAPPAVRSFLERADPADETVRVEEFESWRCRIFGVTPRESGVIPAAKAKSAELGFRVYELTEWLHAEASAAGRVIANIAQSIENRGEPFEPPCVLLTSGELLVTVGQENGVGGRNQEYALAAALTIAGSRNIVMAGVDTDGTDGPGGFSAPDAGAIHCLSGGIVDGETLAEAKQAGVDIHDALKRHATSDALWRLKSGVVATQNISLTDLGVTLIMGRASDPNQLP